MEVIPAILPKNLAELRDGLERLQGTAKLVQIDLVGKNVLDDQEAFPFWEEFDFECDIILSEALRSVQQCVSLGASRIVVHSDNQHAREALGALQATRSGDYAIAAGVALRAHDTPDALAQFEGLYDYVQVMGIEKVGFQGQPFDERSLELIKNLHANDPHLVIQVDGGVRMENIQAVVAAGASRLVVGSLILKSDDVKKTIREILERANHTLGS